jgi:hypothetical protein
MTNYVDVLQGETKMKYFPIVAVAIALAGVSPAYAQIITGTTTVYVNNTFGQSVSLNSQSCTGCSYSTSPPTSISNNTTSSAYLFTATTAGTNGMSTVSYTASKSGHTYTCQFQVQNLASEFGSGCGTPSYTPSATSGYGGSPTCSSQTTTPTVDPSTCNFSITFYMKP